MGKGDVVPANAGDFAEQVDIAEIGREREVEAALDRGRIEAEWQSRGSPSKVRAMWGERDRETMDVFG